MTGFDLLIRNARVRDDPAFMNIGIKDGKIVALGEGIESAARETIDAAGRAVIPGLIESHLHLDKALLHGRLPAPIGTLDEAIRVTSILKAKQERADVLDRSRQVLDMAVKNGTVHIRAHPDVDLIQGLIGVETLLQLRSEYEDLLDIQIVAFPQEGILKSQGTYELLERAMNLGADVVVGCPYSERSWDDARRHIDMVFEMAQKHDADVDIHADFADEVADQRFACAAYIARKTIETGYQGRVALGHVTSLDALNSEERTPVIELLREADISIVTLPATDLYLGGRKDEKKQRRAITPVRALLHAGVNVAYSSNNVRNAFTPFGNGDMLVIGNMLAHVIQFGTSQDQATVLDMATENAARAIGIEEQYGIAVGKQADLIVLDTYAVADALLDMPSRSWVIKRGKITVVTQHSCEIRRGPRSPHSPDQS